LLLDSKKSAFIHKQLTLAKYCTFLSESAAKQNISIDSYKQLKAFLESLALEKTVDFKEAEAQRSAFIKELAQKLHGPLVKELIAKTADFKDKKISAPEYYEFLRSAAQGNLDIKKQYPHFEAYMQYVEMGRNIDAEKLLIEISAIEGSLFSALSITGEERTLCGISDALDTLAQFLRLDLTPAEYAAMQNSKSQYKTASWINFLTDCCSRYEIPAHPSASSVIDENFDTFETFYKVGIDREQAFIRNISNKIKNSPESNIVVVITGGFHTAGLSKLFKEYGYSYAVVTPALSQKADPAIYYSVLRGENEEIEDTYLSED